MFSVVGRMLWKGVSDTLFRARQFVRAYRRPLLLQSRHYRLEVRCLPFVWPEELELYRILVAILVGIVFRLFIAKDEGKTKIMILQRKKSGANSRKRHHPDVTSEEDSILKISGAQDKANLHACSLDLREDENSSLHNVMSLWRARWTFGKSESKSRCAELREATSHLIRYWNAILDLTLWSPSIASKGSQRTPLFTQSISSLRSEIFLVRSAKRAALV